MLIVYQFGIGNPPSHRREILDRAHIGVVYLVIDWSSKDTKNKDQSSLTNNQSKKPNTKEVIKMAKATIQIQDTVAEISLATKTFKSLKQGFFGQSKVEVDGKRYQAQVLMTEIKK